jgi:hypothetical protein
VHREYVVGGRWLDLDLLAARQLHLHLSRAGFGLYVDNGDPVPDDDRPLSLLWHRVTTVTVVDEMTLSELGRIGVMLARRDVPDVVAMLDGYSWGDWEPARVEASSNCGV